MTKKSRYHERFFNIPGFSPDSKKLEKYHQELIDPLIEDPVGVPVFPTYPSKKVTASARESFRIPSHFTLPSSPHGYNWGTAGTQIANIADIVGIVPVKEMRGGKVVARVYTPSPILQAILQNPTSKAALRFLSAPSKKGADLYFFNGAYGAPDSYDSAVFSGAADYNGNCCNARGWGKLQSLFHTPDTVYASLPANQQPPLLAPFTNIDVSDVPFSAEIDILLSYSDLLGGGVPQGYSYLVQQNRVLQKVRMWDEQTLVLNQSSGVTDKPTTWARVDRAAGLLKPFLYRSKIARFNPNCARPILTDEVWDRITVHDVGLALPPSYINTLTSAAIMGGVNLALGHNPSNIILPGMVGLTIPEMVGLYSSVALALPLYEECRNDLSDYGAFYLGEAPGGRTPQLLPGGQDSFEGSTTNQQFGYDRFVASKIKLSFPSPKDMVQGTVTRLVSNTPVDHRTLSPTEILNHHHSHTVNVSKLDGKGVTLHYSPTSSDDFKWTFESFNGYGDRGYGAIVLVGLNGGTNKLASVNASLIPYNIDLQASMLCESREFKSLATLFQPLRVIGAGGETHDPAHPDGETFGLATGQLHANLQNNPLRSPFAKEHVLAVITPGAAAATTAAALHASSPPAPGVSVTATAVPLTPAERMEIEEPVTTLALPAPKTIVRGADAVINGAERYGFVTRGQAKRLKTTIGSVVKFATGQGVRPSGKNPRKRSAPVETSPYKNARSTYSRTRASRIKNQALSRTRSGGKR